MLCPGKDRDRDAFQRFSTPMPKECPVSPLCSFHFRPAIAIGVCRVLIETQHLCTRTSSYDSVRKPARWSRYQRTNFNSARPSYTSPLRNEIQPRLPLKITGIALYLRHHGSKDPTITTHFFPRRSKHEHKSTS